VATDSSGNVVLGGRGGVGGLVGYPIASATDAGTTDAGVVIPGWVSKFDSNGNLLWTVATPQGAPIAQHIAVGPSGDVYVLAYAAEVNTLLVKYDSNGNLQWTRQFAVATVEPPLQAPYFQAVTPHRAMTVDSSGNVALAFDVSAPLDLDGIDGGTPPAYDAGAPVWLLVASLDPSGATRWSHTFAVAQDPNLVATSTSPDLAPGAGGAIVVGGTYWSTIDFGGGPLPQSGQDNGDRGAFLATFDTNGALVWSRGFGKPHRNLLAHLAGNGKGAVAVTGSFSDEIDFGSIRLVAEAPDGQTATRTFVAGITVP
jgi:hypothetical protein